MHRVVPILLFLLTSVASLEVESSERITFIKYKNYLIPIKLPPEIDAPTLTATKDDANSVFLVWSQPAGATTYELWRLDPVLNWTRIYSGTDVTYTDVQPPAGNITYTIKPCNAEGCSRSNAQASVTIPETNTGGGWTFEDDPTAPPNPDLDGDGVHNDNDFCPFTPANQAVNAYGCAITGAGDQTGGGQPFQCIDPATGQPSNDSNCSVDEQDADFDGIPNATDAYPLQPSGAGFCPGI